jgi:hypothetical protein
VQNWLGHFERGDLSALDYTIVSLLFVAGLALLILQFIPARRRYLTLAPDARIEREVVEKEAEHLALTDQAVLESRAKLSPHEYLDTKLSLEVVVRKGEGREEAVQRLREILSAGIGETGHVKIDKTRIRAHVKDPRAAKRRVK